MIIESNNDGVYDNYRIPGIISTDTGSLIIYYECRKARSDWAEIDLGMKKSIDGGISWSERRILVYGNGKTVNNPIMFSDSGKILFMWQEEYRKTFVCESFDDGETFSAPCEITRFITGLDYTVIACGPGHGTVLKNGRYITAVWLCNNPSDLRAHHPSVTAVLYSDDKGKTWTLGPVVNDSRLIDSSEATIAQLPDGEVVINLRNESEVRSRFLAESKNSITEWVNPRFEPGLPDPVCAAGTVSDGQTVYFTNCASRDSRTNLTLYSSSDGCKTWSKGVLIDACAGYSDIAFDSKANTLIIFYESQACVVAQTISRFRIT